VSGESVFMEESAALLPEAEKFAGKAGAAAARIADEVFPALSTEAARVEPAQSMTPRAFKVLTADGRSPWARQIRWSLPKRTDDGNWLPGKWKLTKEDVPMPTRSWQGFPYKPGIYVTNAPHEWKQLADIALDPESPSKIFSCKRFPVFDLGSPAKRVAVPETRVFEVQIGDDPSIMEWQSHASDNFRADRVRLLRPISQEELSKIEADCWKREGLYQPKEQWKPSEVIPGNNLDQFVVEEKGGPSVYMFDIDFGPAGRAGKTDMMPRKDKWASRILSDYGLKL
jgi:hypothetical protein